MIDKVFPKIHNEGYKFLVIFGLGTLVLYLISGFLGLIGVILTIWVYYFFRDPDRFPINDENYLVSPADGLVIKVEEVNGPSELSLENSSEKSSDNSLLNACTKKVSLSISMVTVPGVKVIALA